MISQQLMIVFGVALVDFLFIYFAVNLEKEHWVLRTIMMVMALILILLIPKAFVNFNENCYPVVTQSNITTVGDTDIVTNAYGEYCTTKDVNTATTFYVWYLWFLKIFGIYLLLWLFWTYAGEEMYHKLMRYTGRGK